MGDGNSAPSIAYLIFTSRLPTSRAEIRSNADHISLHPYLYLFCLANTNMD